MYSAWYSCTWFLKSDNSIRQSYCRRRAINFLQSRPYISSPQLRARANHTGHTALEVNRNFHFRISLHRKFSPPRVLYRSPRLYILYHCGLKFFLKKHFFDRELSSRGLIRLFSSSCSVISQFPISDW